ncbi:MAG: DMT family transporter [Leptospirales bacterium]|jgi:drug/metabolite transporter (DMT)-like permease
MPLKDVGAAVLVAFLWALCFPLITFGLSGAPPLLFGGLRACLAGLFLLLLSLRGEGALNVAREFTFREWGLLILTGLSFTALGFAGMFLAGGKIGPGLATVLANLQPLMAAVLAHFLINEKLSAARITGLGVAFAGILFIAGPAFFENDSSDGVEGVLFLLMGAVGTAAGNIGLKRVSGFAPPLFAAGFQFLFGGLTLLSASSVLEPNASIDWSLNFTFSLFVLSFLGTALATVLWLQLLARNPLNRVNLFSYLAPIFAMMIGVAFFAERPGPLEIVGIVLIFIGILSGVKRKAP